MLVLLSPAKKQNFDQPLPDFSFTQPQAKNETAVLVESLKRYRPSQLEKLMSISATLATLNHQRFMQFDPKHYTQQNAFPAVFAFQGDAYRSLDPRSLPQKAVEFMQSHLIILSGLYGCLRPLDFIQPYRCEMKTRLPNPKGNDLYAFWEPSLTEMINTTLKKNKLSHVINLASQEYFNAVNQKNLIAPVITVHFKEKRGNTYKTIGTLAKAARGKMTRYIMEKSITEPKQLRNFKEDGYQFDAALSTEEDFTFTRA